MYMYLYMCVYVSNGNFTELFLSYAAHSPLFDDCFSIPELSSGPRISAGSEHKRLQAFKARVV